jgi:Bax protein
VEGAEVTQKIRRYTKALTDFRQTHRDDVVLGSFNRDVEVSSYQELNRIFKDCDFTLAHTNSTHSALTVPRLYLVALPKDFRQASLDSKKQLFVKSLLPLILRANEKILQERRQLLAIMAQHDAGFKLSPAQHQWLVRMAHKYRLKHVCFKELKKRIDIIPPSLALGQAIVETGWGTSRSALHKNSTFGMSVGNRVLRYNSLQESVESYMRNINVHPAYEKMRLIRQHLRRDNQKLCSIKLAKGLINYSIRRESYVWEVSHLISRYNLQKYDTAYLTDDLHLRDDL